MSDTIICVNERQLATIKAALRHLRETRWKSLPSLMTNDEINALLDSLSADQPVIAAARGCGLCGSTALPDSKLCGPCAGVVVDRGPSAEKLARECATAVATRKLGDTPQVSAKGMTLGSVMTLPMPLNTFACGCVGTDPRCPMHKDGHAIPHHGPFDPTDSTTLTGDERKQLLACRDLGGEG